MTLVAREHRSSCSGVQRSEKYTGSDVTLYKIRIWIEIGFDMNWNWL